MSARAEFYQSINLLLELSNDPFLTDVFPPTAAHNQRARILRNGLVISAFSMFETYLEDRINEAISDLPRTNLPYSAFSDELRSFLSLDAVLGLGNRIGFVDKSDRLSFAEAELIRLSTAGGIGYTGLGFSPKGSNVSADDLNSLLKAFGIRNTWSSLSTICSSLGASPVSFLDDFRNLARARNKAAHESTTNIATSDLKSYLNTALLVGMATDLALTNAVNSFVRETSLSSAIMSANLLPSSFRFVDEDVNGKWIERTNPTGRVIKRYPDKSAAKMGAKARATKFSIVLRDTRSIPVELLE